MALPLIPVAAALIMAAKAYFVLHGIHIATRAIIAGARAHMAGEDVIEEAMKAGASAAAADALQDFLHGWFS